MGMGRGGFCGVPVKRIVQLCVRAMSDSKTQMGRDAFPSCILQGTGNGEVWKEILNLRHLSGRFQKRLSLEVEELDGKTFLYRVHMFIF